MWSVSIWSWSSKTSPDVLDDDSSDDRHKEDGNDDGEDSGQKQLESVVFTAEEETLFNCWFVEGFDIFDARYHDWLKINHPESILFISKCESRRGVIWRSTVHALTCR